MGHPTDQKGTYQGMKNRFIKRRKAILSACCILCLSMAVPPVATVAAEGNGNIAEGGNGAEDNGNKAEGNGSTAKSGGNAAENYVWPKAPAIASEAGIVMEASTGNILYEKNIHDVHYPASITKIMTALLALENCKMEEIVTVPAEAVYMEDKGSHIALDVGEELTVEQCLYAIMLASANDAAYALAEHIGSKFVGQSGEETSAQAGSESAYDCFIRLMNDRAKELGCQDTNFTNPHGLPDASHVTSAYDMALIARAAIQYDMFRTVSSTTYYEIPPSEHQKDLICMYNHHKMIGVTDLQNPEVFAGKNGYTDVARYTLVTCAQRDGMDIICVVLQASADSVYQDTLTLINYGLDSFSKSEISQDAGYFEEMLKKEDPTFENCTVSRFRYDSPYVIIPKEGSLSDLSIRLTYEDAPETGTVSAQYYYGNHLVGQMEFSVDGIQKEVDLPEDTASLSPSEEQSTEKHFKWWYVLLIIVILILLAVAALKIYVEWRRYQNRLRRRRLRQQNRAAYRKQYKNR